MYVIGGVAHRLGVAVAVSLTVDAILSGDIVQLHSARCLTDGATHFWSAAEFPSASCHSVAQ